MRARLGFSPKGPLRGHSAFCPKTYKVRLEQRLDPTWTAGRIHFGPYKIELSTHSVNTGKPRPQRGLSHNFWHDEPSTRSSKTWGVTG